MTGTPTLPPASFGLAEPNTDGVMFAMRFGADGAGMLLSPSRPLRLAEPGDGPGNGFIWIHLSLADVRALSWLQRQPELDRDIVEAMIDTADSPRVELAGAVQAGVLADLMLEIDHPTDEPAGLAFALGPDFLVTGRRRPVQSVQRVQRRIAAGETAATPLDLLRLILEAEIDTLGDRMDALSTAIEIVENRLLGDSVTDERRPIAQMRRTAFNLNRHIYGMLALFRSVYRQRAGRVPQPVREAFEEAGQRVEALQHELQSIKERARLLNEEAASKLAMETNRQLYILSMLSGVFLPATLVTGFFGMNTSGMITETHTGFAIVIGIAASAAVYFGLIRLGQRR